MIAVCKPRLALLPPLACSHDIDGSSFAGTMHQNHPNVSALIWSSLNSQHSNLQALTGAHIHRAVQQIRAEDVLDARGHGLAAVV